MRASDVALLLRGAALIERPVNRIIGRDPQLICGRIEDSCGRVLDQAVTDFVKKSVNPDSQTDKAWITLYFEGVVAAGQRPPTEIDMIEAGARGGARSPEVMAWVERTLERTGQPTDIAVENEIDVAVDISGSKGTVCYVRESNLRITAPPTQGEHHVAAAFRLSADIIQAQAIFDEYAERAKGGVHRTAQRARAVKELPPKVQISLKELTAGIRASARKAAIKFWPEEPDFFFSQFDEDAIAAEHAAQEEAEAAHAAEEERLQQMQPASIEEVLSDDFSGIAGDVETKNLAAVAADNEDMPFLDDEDAEPVVSRSAKTAARKPEPPRRPAARTAPPPDTGDPPAEDLLDVALMIKRLITRVVEGLSTDEVKSELNRLYTRVTGMLNPPTQAMASHSKDEPRTGPSEDDLRAVASELKTLAEQVDATPDLPSLRSGLEALLSKVTAMAEVKKKPRPAPVGMPRALSDQEREDVIEISEAVQELADRVDDGLDNPGVEKELSALLERVNTLATQHTMF